MRLVHQPPCSVAVFGAGHWLLGEDNVGPRVMAALAGTLGADVEVRDIGTSGLDLIDHLRGQALAIVVDACTGVAHAGDVVVREPDLDGDPVAPAGVHQIGPVETLAIARHLYPERLPKRSLLVLVDTGELDEDGQESAVLRAAAAVRELIASHRNHRPCGPQKTRHDRSKGGDYRADQ